MKYDLFELSVAVPSKHGSSKIPEYGHAGLTFVEGRRNQPFNLNLRNNSAQRVLAVVSIDGVNVVDGQPCTPQSRGYVIPAYSSVEIEGWRTSLQEVHQFKFEDKETSYAKSSTGSTQNCGVIAAKFFSEKSKPLPAFIPPTIIQEHHHHHHHDWPWPWRRTWPEVWYTSSGGSTSVSGTSHEGPIGATGPQGCTGNPGLASAAAYSCSMSSAVPPTITCSAGDIPDFKLGTGWGSAKLNCVTETEFEREKELCTLLIYYAEATDLEKVGVTLTKDLAVTPPASPVLPQAFPGFCKPPVSQ